jgi:cobalt-zinc-cadmium efflux system outer membrane protein
MTVDELVRAGLTNNKDLAAARERIAEMRGQARQARVWSSPTVELSGTTAEPFGTAGEHGYGAALSQTFEVFGKRSKRASVADIAIDLAEANADDRAAELTYEIRAEYALLLANRGKLKQLDELIVLNQETLRLTEARVREGDVAALEANILKVEIARAGLARRSAQARAVSDEVELRRLTGLSADAALPEAVFVLPAVAALEALQQQGLRQRADINRARLEERQQTAGLALARAEWKPDVTVSAAYDRQSTAFEGLYAVNGAGAPSPIRDQVNSLTFGVSIPLRTARSHAGAVQSAIASTAGARLRREQLEHSIPLEVAGAYERWRGAEEALQLLDGDILKASAANLAVMREAYTLGQLRLLDVLNEQRRLTETQMQRIDAESDRARAWAELERAAGGLLP